MGSIKECTFLHIFLVFIILFLSSPSTILANEGSYYCADIWACDENGEILPELRLPDHPCFLHYDLQCRNVRLELLYAACEEQLENADLEAEHVRKRLRRFRRKTT